jgi:hypothetical protein
VSYHRRPERENVLPPGSRPELTFEALAGRDGRRPFRLVDEQVEEHLHTDAWRVVARARWTERGYVLEPASSAWVNGLPLDRVHRVESGDVLESALTACRMVVAGEPTGERPDQLAGSFVSALAVGLLELDEREDGLHARLRWRDSSEDDLVAFSRTSLAARLASLTVVLAPRWSTKIAERLPAITADLPPGFLKRVRLVGGDESEDLDVVRAAPMTVRFDGEPLNLDTPLWLAGTGVGLAPFRGVLSAPRVFRDGTLPVLSFEEGAGSVVTLQLVGAAIGIEPQWHTRIPLLEGDEWLLDTRGRQHHLSVAREELRPTAPGFPKRRQPPERQFVLQRGPVSHLYRLGRDGVFRSTTHRAEFIVDAGDERAFAPVGPPAAPFRLYEWSDGFLCLPRRSPFLAMESWRVHPLTAEAVAVLLDRLSDEGDGAVELLRRLSEKEASAALQPLIMQAALRAATPDWSALPHERVGPFWSSVDFPSLGSARHWLRAFSSEPLFQSLAVARVELDDAEPTAIVDRPATTVVQFHRSGSPVISPSASRRAAR